MRSITSNTDNNAYHVRHYWLVSASTPPMQGDSGVVERLGFGKKTVKIEDRPYGLILLSCLHGLMRLPCKLCGLRQALHQGRKVGGNCALDKATLYSSFATSRQKPQSLQEKSGRNWGRIYS